VAVVLADLAVAVAAVVDRAVVGRLLFILVLYKAKTLSHDNPGFFVAADKPPCFGVCAG
jgi:hypothetical protein